MRTIRVDGVEYHVNLKYATLVRSFTILEGRNKGDALTGRTIRDIIGTRYDYELAIEQDEDYSADYDAFYEVISSPVETHVVTFPYGQTTVTYECMIEDGSDTYMGTYGGVELWNGLVIRFIAIEPKNNSTVATNTRYIDAREILPTTEDIIIRAGAYISGDQTIFGDINLIPENILEGVSIFGVDGAVIAQGDMYVLTPLDVHEVFLEGWFGINNG